MNRLSTVLLSALVSGITPTATSAAALATIATGLAGGAAVNPVDTAQAAVGIGGPGAGGCSVRLSADGGNTWAPALLPEPQVLGAPMRSYCANTAPAVVYSADGLRLYAAYPYQSFDQATGEYNSGVLASSSADRGATWSAPAAALPENWLGGPIDPESPGGSEVHNVSIAAAPDSPWVYVSSTIPTYTGNVLAVSSSPDGYSWTTTSPAYGDGYFGFVMNEKSSIAAGTSGSVLVAYGVVQISPTHQLLGEIKVARSIDNGATFVGSGGLWSPPAGAIVDRNPGGWASNPDIKIGPGKTAHLVYDRTRNGVFYKYSLPPYVKWTLIPIGAAPIGWQASFPRVATGTCGSATVLSATWLEGASGQPSKLAYTYKVAKNGFRWAPPVRANVPYVLDNFLAEVGGNALIELASWTNGQQTPATLSGTASSGVVCR